jgi:2'-5' RNA ligase
VLFDLDALPPPRPLQASPALAAAADRAIELVNRWDDGAAHELFADNVEIDEALQRRAREAAEAIARHGTLTKESFEVDAPQRGDVVAAGGQVRIELELNHAGDVQWWLVNDRARPSDAPIVTDPRTLAELPRSAYVLLRPAGDLADAFERWQGGVLDRLGGASCALPAPHVTLKAWGSSVAPVAATDEARIADVVAAWSTDTAAIRLEAASLDAWDGDEAVPVALLTMTDQLAAAIRDLWTRSADAGLPAGYSDDIGAEGWRAHLSFCYPRERPPAAIWEPLRAWLRHQDTGRAESVAYEAELVAFGDGAERRLGRFPLTR